MNDMGSRTGWRFAQTLVSALWLACAGCGPAQDDVYGDVEPGQGEDAGAEPSHTPGVGDPTVRVTTDSGDEVVCLQTARQPGLALSGGVLRTPPRLPDGVLKHRSNEASALESAACPSGTTPVYPLGELVAPSTWSQHAQWKARRLEALRALSKHNQGRGERDDDRERDEGRLGSRDPHQHAVAFAWTESYGLSARLSVWKPALEHESDFSLAQLWVVGGVEHGKAPERAQTVEAGWHVARGMYGDDVPRLFGYWTPDGYETGCYNLACAGFVQVSQRVGLGARFVRFNEPERAQGTSVQMTIVKDGAEGDWWLWVDGEWVGYWPRDLFSGDGLRERAELVEVGGEVHSLHSPAAHTRTHMGAGSLVARAGARAAWIDRILNHAAPGELTTPELKLQITDRHCYDAELTRSGGRRDDSEPVLLFGGPGYSRFCR